MTYRGFLRRTPIALAALVLTLSLLSGCGIFKKRQANAKIEAVQQSLDAARSQGADRYLPQLFAQATQLIGGAQSGVQNGTYDEAIMNADSAVGVIDQINAQINGKRQEIEEKTFPGYVLVDMILTDDSWYVVRNTPRVTGFVGSDTTTPLPLSQAEVDNLMAKMGGADKKFKVDLKIGDVVKITDGPFKDYEAKVSQVDEKTGVIKVLIAIFGRDTAVELDSLQVQKL